MTTTLVARIRPQHTVDILFVIALSVLAMSGWSSTFAGPGWWIAATVSAVLGIAIAVAISDAGGGIEWVLLTLILLYFLVAGPLAVARVELIGINTFEIGMTESGSSWKTLMTTHPPVDAQGAVLLPVVLLSLFAPALAVSLSIRSTRMLAPLVPPGLAFVAVILMGQHIPSSVIGQGLAFAGVAVLWMRVRAQRDEESGTGHDPARGRRLAGSVALILAVSLLVLAVAGPSTDPPTGPTSGTSAVEIDPPISTDRVDPPLTAERFLLRDEAMPYDAERLRTPLDRFREFTQQNPDAERNVFDDRLLRVQGAPVGSRIRFVTLDSYDGERWEAENDTDPLRLDDRFLRLSSTIDNPSDGDLTEVTVTLSGKWDSPWVPTIGALQSFDFDRSALSDRDNLRYNPATSTAVMTDTLSPQDRYTFSTRIDDITLGRDDPAAPYFSQKLYDEAEFLEVATGLGRLGSRGRIDAMFNIAADLRRNGRYSDGAGLEARFEAGQSRKRLGAEFINVTPTVGNDEQYAAAFALMVNRLRIPARVVVGAVIPPNGAIRGRDMQAWVEVRIADGTWRTVPTEVFMSRQSLSTPPASIDIEPRAFPDPIDRADAEADEEADQTRPDPEADQTSSNGLSRGVLFLLGLPLLLLGALPWALKRWRWHRRRRAATGAARYAGAWAEFIDRSRDLGHDVPRGLTRPAQARVLARADHLAVMADRATFASTDPEHEAAAEFWALVETELADLTHAAPRWRRIWSRFTPRSLRHRSH